VTDLLFRQLFERESSTYSYLIAARTGGEAVLIDPVKVELRPSTGAWLLVSISFTSSGHGM
jgi:hypothetical protein